MEKMEQVLVSEIRDSENKTLKCYIVTAGVNRGQRKIDPQGGRFDDYFKSPVVLAFHDDTKVIGRCVDLSIETGGILATFEFNHTRLADDIFRLYKEGFLTSWSIGFLPLEMKQEKEGGKDVLHITNWMLLEVSAVSVPMDADAVTVAIGQGLIHDELLLQSLRLKPESDFSSLKREIPEFAAAYVRKIKGI
ncbi:MAG: HK97 family phage prohead protease [Syntrophomonadaceae bacterium]